MVSLYSLSSAPPSHQSHLLYFVRYSVWFLIFSGLVYLPPLFNANFRDDWTFSRKCLFQGHIFSGFSISQTLISAPQRLAANSKLQCLFSVCPSWHRRPSAACRLVAWTTLLLLFSLIAMPLTLYECRSLFAGSTGSSLGQSTDYCLLSTSS